MMQVIGNIRDEIESFYEKTKGLVKYGLNKQLVSEECIKLLKPHILDTRYDVYGWFSTPNEFASEWHQDGSRYDYFIICSWPNPTQHVKIPEELNPPRYDSFSRDMDKFVKENEQSLDIITPDKGDILLMKMSDVHRTNPETVKNNNLNLVLRIYCNEPAIKKVG